MKKTTEAEKYILWIEGRLGELERSGHITGSRCMLTRQGAVAYEAVKRSGFKPEAWKLLLAMGEHPTIPGALVPVFTALILSDQPGSDTNRRP